MATFQVMNEVPDIDFTLLSINFSKYMAAKLDLQEFDKQPLPEQPQQPELFETPADYFAYKRSVSEYNQLCKSLHTKRGVLLKIVEEAESAVRQMIPVHTWFPTEFNGNQYWIGISTTNWGGYTSSLEIREQRPEGRLRHQTID